MKSTQKLSIDYSSNNTYEKISIIKKSNKRQTSLLNGYYNSISNILNLNMTQESINKESVSNLQESKDDSFELHVENVSLKKL